MSVETRVGKRGNVLVVLSKLEDTDTDEKELLAVVRRKAKELGISYIRLLGHCINRGLFAPAKGRTSLKQVREQIRQSLPADAVHEIAAKYGIDVAALKKLLGA